MKCLLNHPMLPMDDIKENILGWGCVEDEHRCAQCCGNVRASDGLRQGASFPPRMNASHLLLGLLTVCAVDAHHCSWHTGWMEPWLSVWQLLVRLSWVPPVPFQVSGLCSALCQDII